MAVKQYNWVITVEYTDPKSKLNMVHSKVFTIGAIECNKKQALQIAKILIPEWESESIRLKSIINKTNEI